MSAESISFGGRKRICLPLMKIVYLLLIGGCWLFYLLFPDKLSFYALLTVMIFPVLLLIITVITAFSAKMGAVSENRADIPRKNSRLHFRMWVKNRVLFPMPSVTFEFSCKNSFADGAKKSSAVIALPAFGKGGASAVLTSEHCGDITFCLESVVFHDMFRMFRIKRRCGAKLTIPVLPDDACLPADICAEAENADGELFSQLKSGDDPSEIFGIREYRDGDPMNRVLTKLGGKTDSMLVKELSLPMETHLSVLADLSLPQKTEERLKAADQLLNSLNAVSMALLSENIPFRICRADSFGEMIASDIPNEDELYTAFREIYSEIAENNAVSGAFEDIARELSGHGPVCAAVYDDMEKIHTLTDIFGNSDKTCIIAVTSENEYPELGMSENVVLCRLAEKQEKADA